MNPDPRLTAYAQGELEPAEREAFERDLAASPDLQAELQATIHIADTLMKTLPEETDVLTEPQRDHLRAAHAAPPAAPRRRFFVPLLTGLAACLAAAFFVRFGGSHDDKLLPPERQVSPTGIASTAPAAPRVDLMNAPTVTTMSGSRAEVSVLREFTYPVDAPAAPQAGAMVALNQEPTVREKSSQAFGGALEAASSGEKEVAKSDPAEGMVLMKERSLFASKQIPSAQGAVGGAFYGRLRPFAENTESYDAVAGNTFLEAVTQPLSTFSIDVDTASYANVRRFLNNGQQPPAEAVRLEELINYFPYPLPLPEGDAPFSVTTEVSHAPWNPAHLLARIALKGRDLDADKLPASNLVFLIDVSGSMNEPNKLPLLQRSLRELVSRLTSRDTVAIVTYAGNSGLALRSTSGAEQARILDAIDRLEPGGSTNGAAGIQLAYDQARENFRKSGNNRVILCTDGDFNVGVTSRGDLTTIIERERKSGVFLSVLGFGTGNVKDSAMENLADRGNGNYAYIDSPSEGRKVLVEQMGATLFTIAKDVKIQVEFNPATVAGYRLIGYENRLLAKEDFNDDTKDAGEIGAGHAVTALYEIVPAGATVPGQPTVDPLKYQAPAEPSQNPKSKIQNPKSPDLFTVKLRFKAPDGDVSRLIEKVVSPSATEFAKASDDFRFASAVAAFGMKLRGDRNDATMDWNAIQQIARGSLGEDPGAYRAEFLTLIEKAKNVSAK